MQLLKELNMIVKKSVTKKSSFFFLQKKKSWFSEIYIRRQLTAE